MTHSQESRSDKFLVMSLRVWTPTCYKTRQI